MSRPVGEAVYVWQAYERGEARTSSVHRLKEIQFPPEELVMELCKPLHVRTAERVPYGLELSGNATLDSFRERRSL